MARYRPLMIPAVLEKLAFGGALLERRRIGPFATAEGEPKQREKWIAAMIRAGHGFALARTIAEIAPGTDIDPEALRNLRR